MKVAIETLKPDDLFLYEYTKSEIICKVVELSVNRYGGLVRAIPYFLLEVGNISTSIASTENRFDYGIMVTKVEAKRVAEGILINLSNLTNKIVSGG